MGNLASGSALGGGPGEGHDRGQALVVVVRRRVDRDAELVAVLLATGEGAERDVAAHRRDRARVLDRVAGVAGRRAGGEVAAVLDDDVELGRELVRGVAVDDRAALELEGAGQRAAVLDVDLAGAGRVAGAHVGGAGEDRRGFLRVLDGQRASGERGVRVGRGGGEVRAGGGGDADGDQHRRERRERAPRAGDEDGQT